MQLPSVWFNVAPRAFISSSGFLHNLIVSKLEAFSQGSISFYISGGFLNKLEVVLFAVWHLSQNPPLRKKKTLNLLI